MSPWADRDLSRRLRHVLLHSRQPLHGCAGERSHLGQNTVLRAEIRDFLILYVHSFNRKIGPLRVGRIDKLTKSWHIFVLRNHNMIERNDLRIAYHRVGKTIPAQNILQRHLLLLERGLGGAQILLARSNLRLSRRYVERCQSADLNLFLVVFVKLLRDGQCPLLCFQIFIIRSQTVVQVENVHHCGNHFRFEVQSRSLQDWFLRPRYSGCLRRLPNPCSRLCWSET